MTRTTIAAVTAMLLTAGAAAPARADGWSWGLSLGVGFPIGDCGWGGISVGIPIGGYDCGSRYRPYSDPWPYYGGGGVCSPAYYRPVCERPYNGGWNGAAYAAGASVVPARAVAAAPVQPARAVETEPDAWKALAAGDASAMEIFGRLVAQSKTAGTPEIGYAICAAQAGQLDRAEWAAGQAMRASPDVWSKVPNEPGIKAAAASALALLADGGAHAQLAAALRRVAGEPAPASPADTRTAGVAGSAAVEGQVAVK